MPLLSQLCKRLRTCFPQPSAEPKASSSPKHASVVAQTSSVVAGRTVIHHLGRKIVADNIPGVAASLSYTSLLALVPLLSVSFAMLTAFPAFSGARSIVQAFIFQELMPAAGPATQQTIMTFITATGKLTAIGVTGLAITAVLLLTTIEKAFNAIFRATRGRSWGNRLLVYWTLLTLGPLLMGAASAIGGSVASATSDAGIQAGKLLGLGNVRSLWQDFLGGLSDFLPPLLVMACFAMLYWAVPTRRIRTKDAIIGAALATVAFIILRSVFFLFFAKGGSYQTIYGALATVPLLLLWMYLSWLVVLSGAVIVANMPELRDLWREHRHADESHPHRFRRQPLYLAVGALLSLEDSVPEGLSTITICARLQPEQRDQNLEQMDGILHTLRAAKLTVRDERGLWHRTISADKCLLSQVVDALGYGLPPEVLRPLGGGAAELAKDYQPWQHSLQALLSAGQQQLHGSLALPLAELKAVALPPKTH